MPAVKQKVTMAANLIRDGHPAPRHLLWSTSSAADRLHRRFPFRFRLPQQNCRCSPRPASADSLLHSGRSLPPYSDLPNGQPFSGIPSGQQYSCLPSGQPYSCLPSSQPYSGLPVVSRTQDFPVVCRTQAGIPGVNLLSSAADFFQVRYPRQPIATADLPRIVQPRRSVADCLLSLLQALCYMALRLLLNSVYSITLCYV